MIEIKLMKIDKRAGMGAKKMVSPELYFLALVYMLALFVAQDFLVQKNMVSPTLAVYILAVFILLLPPSIIMGKPILKHAFSNNRRALAVGLVAFSIGIILRNIIGKTILAFLVANYPQIAEAVQKPGPTIHNYPLFAVILIFVLVVGPVEEYMFRGLIFGGALESFGKKHWLLLASLSSLLFALAHTNYIRGYEIAFIYYLPILFVHGMVFSLTYYLSGGNLFIIAILHGLYNSTSSINALTHSSLGSWIQYSILMSGLLIFLYFSSEYYKKKTLAIN